MKKVLFSSMILYLFFNVIPLQLLACLHFTETFTGSTFPSSYGSGTAVLTTGSWDYAQARLELAANSYGATGNAVRLAKNVANASLTAPAVNSVGTVSFYYRGLNTSSGTFKVQKSVGGGAYTDITTQAFNSTTYTFFTFNVNDNSNNIRIRILSDMNAENLIIDEVIVTNYDVTPPMVTNAVQSVNNTGQSALIQSNEGEGYVYIILDGIAQNTVADLNTAVTNLQGAKAAVTTANSNVSVSALNLTIGNYYAYAVDCHENKSTKGTQVIHVVSSAAAVSGLSFASGNYKIGNPIAITITANGTGYTNNTLTINGRTATNFTDNSNNTYSAVYTVVEGDPDRANAASVPVNIILNSGGNPGTPFTGPATGMITIDANRPVIISSVKLSDTQIKITSSEMLDATSINQSNDGGFTITDKLNSGIQYQVLSISQGSNNTEVLLNCADFSASGISGLNIQYSNSGNGVVKDVAGNLMNTTTSIPSINAWTGVGIDENEINNSDIRLYPNPASDNLFINVPEQYSIQEINVFSINGTCVSSALPFKSQGLDKRYQLSIDISSLPQGSYLLQIKSEQDNLIPFIKSVH
jgi:hypothetical protein